MYVVLDSSVIISEGYGDSRLFELFTSTSSLAGYKVCVPKLVFVEVAADFARMLDRETKKVSKGLDFLSRRLGQCLQSSIDNLDKETENAQYLKRFESKINESGSIIVEYPTTLHEDLVHRAASRQKPFDETGSGYRDALVWDTVIDLASAVSDPVILVSEDPDFANTDKDDKGKRHKKKKNSLHPDLINDLKLRGISKDKVVLMPSLSEFVDVYVRPRLKLSQLDLDTERMIVDSLLKIYSGYEWDPADLGLSVEYESPFLDRLYGISDLHVLDVRELSSTQLLVKVTATLDCDFSVFVYKPDGYVMDDDRLAVYDFAWNDHYLWGGLNLSLESELSLTIDTQNTDEHEVKVLYINPA